MVDSEILLVLRPFSAFPTVNDLAIRAGWRHVQSFAPSNTQFMEEIWEVDDPEAVVRYIDDHFVRAIYLAVSGDGNEETAHYINEHLDIVSEKELWRNAQSNEAENQEMAIRFLSAITDEYNPDLALILDKAADSEHPEVRDAVLLSIGRVAWPELWPIVKRRHEKEQEPDLKDQTDALFDAYSELVEQ